MARAKFKPSRIDIETVDASTFTEYLFVEGPMTLHGQFIINQGPGGYGAVEAKIPLTSEETTMVQAVIDAATERFRAGFGSVLTEE